ncbi:CheR family methyltransferase [Massilia sp. CCM 9210]|uniref:CheR family methyltransferase n=1 Tax=Massilia scottii TaxID=3057166 RepID=UPI0027964C94|nr:CheR family methyltransferase [Massilia sp. CCM 9210]MDQ1812137.1 CheR family methyltransferase [Massilia sp. CCM 9210]
MQSTEELEIDLLLEGVFQHYGFDFRAYDRPGLKRRLLALMKERDLATVSLLQDRVLHDAAAAAALLRALSVRPACLFDDPEQVRQTREVLGACLRASAVPKVWLAECAHAEEAWSLAILLAEQQMDHRTEIFATVANEELLAEAREASIPMERMEQYQENYLKSGGTSNLADYFEVRGKRAVLLPALRSRITWAQYNLVTDASFNEFQLILCRRALADFGPLLRQRALRLFHDSLALFGVLGIDRELSPGDTLASSYRPVLAHQPWYKRVA